MILLILKRAFPLISHTIRPYICLSVATGCRGSFSSRYPCHHALDRRPLRRFAKGTFAPMSKLKIAKDIFDTKVFHVFC